MIYLKKLMVALIAGMSLFVAVGCEREGPMERAGEQVDEGVEETREAVKD